MNEIGLKNPNASLSNLGFGKTTANWNLSREALIQKTLDLQQGVLSSAGVNIFLTSPA